MKCGVCGGGVRGYSGVLHGRPIRDWKHTDVPAGTPPHRPVLGTPVDKATLDRIHRSEEAPVMTKISTEPLVRPRPATAGELAQCSSAEAFVRNLSPEGWRVVGSPTYFQSADATEYLIVKTRRRDLAAVGCWRRRPPREDGVPRPWEFEEGWTLGVQYPFQRVGSKQLKNWIQQRAQFCADCGTSAVAHGQECAA
jgi:hypothetical protein